MDPIDFWRETLPQIDSARLAAKRRHAERRIARVAPIVARWLRTQIAIIDHILAERASMPAGYEEI